MQTEPKPQSGTQDWAKYAQHRARIVYRETVARNVHLYLLDKPEDFTFMPGQAINVALDEPQWREDKHPFMITSRPGNPRLELIVKMHPHSGPETGMTEHLGQQARVNDRVLFDDPWDTFTYRGPGIFVADGVGITLFLSLFRQLDHDETLSGNRLFYSCRTSEEVILQAELARRFGRSAVFTLTEQEHRDYEFGPIDRAWFEHRVHDFDQPFYLCGDQAFVDRCRRDLKDLGVDEEQIVYEKYET